MERIIRSNRHITLVETVRVERIVRSILDTWGDLGTLGDILGGRGQTILEAEIINIKEEFRSALADYADKLA